MPPQHAQTDDGRTMHPTAGVHSIHTKQCHACWFQIPSTLRLPHTPAHAQCCAPHSLHAHRTVTGFTQLVDRHAIVREAMLKGPGLTASSTYPCRSQSCATLPSCALRQQHWLCSRPTLIQLAGCYCCCCCCCCDRCCWPCCRCQPLAGRLVPWPVKGLALLAAVPAERPSDGRRQ